MNDSHLEHPDVEKAIAELGEAVSNLTTEQELRSLALGMAIQVYLKPTRHEYDDIISVAEDFYKFLSAAGSDD